MVAQALDALVGDAPSEAAVVAALTTIPAAELPDALRLLARAHGPAALPVLRHCLSGRAEWAEAGAAALATLPTPEAAATLAAAEATAGTKATRTAFRRALYRLRQAGVTPPPPSPPQPPTSRWALDQAWASAIDGTGSRGVWLVLDTPLGERTLLSAILNDGAGVLDFTSRSVGKKRLDDHLRRLRAESPLPVVALPPSWALHLLVEASGPHVQTGTPLPGDLSRWLVTLPLPEPPASPPIHARLDREAVLADPALRERSAELLTLPELSGWFLEPSTLHAEALELLQARESRLVVSDQIRAERMVALVDRVIDAHFDPEAQRRWQRRLEETAWVLVETGRPTEARLAAAAALALAEPERPARHIPFARALVERSLEVAGEVALGRVSAADVSRTPQLLRP